LRQRDYVYVRGDSFDSPTGIKTQSFVGAYELWDIELAVRPRKVEIDFEIDETKFIDAPPLSVAVQVLDNRAGTIDQSMSFSFTKTVARVDSFEHSEGFSFGRTVGTSVTTGAEVEVGTEYAGVSVSASVSTEETKSVEETEERSVSNTYGGETSTEESFTAESIVAVPAGKVYKCEALVR